MVASLAGLPAAQAKSSAAPAPTPSPNESSAQFYRDLTLKIRQAVQFQVPSPSHNGANVSYTLQFGEPVYQKPMISDTPWRGKYFLRTFWDRILLKDGSTLQLNGVSEEQLPLTCIFIQGQDNRFSGDSVNPLSPQIILRVTLVANDFTCQGPIHPGWPQTGGKKDAWDTYIKYEIHDKTIMLPVDGIIRYRWNELPLLLMDKGPQ